jgi:hypothetical protein
LEDDANKPEPPDPGSFGIDGKYYERAVEGARTWASHRRLPKWLKWTIRSTFFLLPGPLVVFTSDWGSAVGVILASSIVTLGIAQGVIVTIEDIRGAKLKRNIYEPSYNPNPEGYRKYAAAYAEYENELSPVYLSNYWIYHSNPYCCGMRYRWSLQKWQAAARKATACSNCGHLLRVYARLELPRPFGRAFLREELQEFEKDFQQVALRRQEALGRMDENTARLVTRIQQLQERERTKLQRA